MQNLDRESILRIFGLHDASSIARQINAIQLSLEEQDGQMVTFWTEIRKDEKQISLIAGRMDTAETNIGQLQVTATALNASVSSLQTTVNGDGQTTGLVSRVGSLEITANSLNLSVQSLQTTVNGDGQTTGLVSRVSSLEITEGSISQRVGVIEGDYVKNAQISLMVVKDGNGYISNALIDADDIKFVFSRAVSWYWQSEAEANKRMGLDSSGNLWISGEYRGGTITNNIQIGTGTNKMYIKPVGTNGAALVGMNGTNELIHLGFTSINNNIVPFMNLMEKNSYGVDVANTSIGAGSVQAGSSGYVAGLYGDSSDGANLYATKDSSHQIRIGITTSGIIIIKSASLSNWPTDRNSVSVGQVFLGSDEILRVKMA